MFGKESADNKDFIKVPGKSALSDCLNHILNHLDTSLSNDLGVGMSSCHDSNCSRGGTPSLIIKEGIRLASSCLQRNASATIAERYQKNECQLISCNKEEVCQHVHSTYNTEPLEPLVFPLQYLYVKQIIV